MDRRKQSSSRKRPNVDRISTLPDSILCHILSFLPTKVSAKTSILARRWRFLWVDVPNIHLDFYSYGKWNKERRQTSDVINRIFLGHNLKALNTFRLVHTVSKSKDNLTQHQLETWIVAVIARGKVRNIELRFDYYIKLPECLFTYRSLVDLRLYKCEIRIPVPASISFPSLQKLHLWSVKYNNDETFQHLISGCSILKELMVIQDYNGGDIVCSRISSPTLKWLTIDFDQHHAKDIPVEIITPALRYLRVTGYILAKALSVSLTEADIDLKRFKEDVDYCYSVFIFLSRMRNVKYLKFQINYNEFIHAAFSRLSPTMSPRLRNLTKLELVAAGWRLILQFLKIAENLQVLIINGVAQDLKSWVEPQQVCTCLISHLKSIVIQSFWCKEYEFTLVRYLLKNAKVLARMEIHCQVYEQNEKFDALKRISLFERGSEACKLDFC